ncbi:S-adenosylmethionine--tRNA ribosyltransferase-isomerase [Thalassoporum mexicanum PCC 7367]|uniref:tRNA preQ1(34) S-adenosylmethionine ribosyltransferase-isomerase QueA n=1 Tax=Thalassoporum mexicanum TaxID=3457544 RepID=UPI00029FBFAF|nr:tRNA preQ1(34) S-adenosylmethionine ribosyltransferase-isomerase QueA [Pseudanabaena sp. PCC 7367]AFY69971.1 S-adenosylmethionine--tRNA ribosyltransferase-isomerase [Pseudanabaena sp. PCC 7367]
MSSIDHRLSSYDYELPPEFIAQNPCVPRDRSRLMCIDVQRQISDRHFFELPQFLQPGDLLVLNNTKVIPARLYGHKETGTAVEILLTEPLAAANCWTALVKPGKRFKLGSKIIFSEQLSAEVVDYDPETRGRKLQFYLKGIDSLDQAIANLGQVPFPPYVTASQATADQYQTIYAKTPGAIAAPTAGLHFTPELLQQLSDLGVAQTQITLHVGIGTFRPVETEDITQHEIHSEWLEVNEAAIAKIKATKANGGRVIGIGTTVARSLESSKFKPYRGKTNLMIYPGYEWQVLDGLITNFHLPKSSLLMLVASFLGEDGRQFLLDAYARAITQGYRFYSFGDAMLIWRSHNSTPLTDT